MNTGADFYFSHLEISYSSPPARGNKSPVLLKPPFHPLSLDEFFSPNPQFSGIVRVGRNTFFIFFLGIFKRDSKGILIIDYIYISRRALRQLSTLVLG